MFIEKVKRQVRTLNLLDREDRAEYNELLQNPSIRIISCDITQQSETDQDGEHSRTRSYPLAIVEIEECGF